MWGLSHRGTGPKAALWLLILFVVQLGCTTDPTQILLFIDFDEATPIDELEMIVVNSTDPQTRTTMTTDLANEQFPLSIAFVNDADTETDLVVELTATGLPGGEINRRARVTFKPNDVQWARVVLEQACAGVSCTENGQTCIHGICAVDDKLNTQDWNADGSSRPPPVHMADGGLADGAVDAGAFNCAEDCWAGCNEEETACKPITALSLGGKHTCAIAGGELWCWGRNDTGELGVGGRTASTTPLRVRGTDSELLGTVFTHVAAGSNFTCAAAANEVWCWGSNASSVQGMATDHVEFPQALTVGTGTVLDLEAGAGHVCAAVSDGVYCWGRNTEGQGNGGRDNLPAPVRVATGAWNRLALGDTHTCAEDSAASRILCWGTTTLRAETEPLPVPGFPATRLVSGASGSCGFIDPNWFCWGDNQHMELLRLGAPITEPTMIDFSGIGNVEQIIMGALHSCALTNNNRLYCWGLITIEGDLDGYVRPKQVVLAPVLVASGGTPTVGVAGHTCAVEAGSRELYCWGNNSHGQLGALTPASGESETPLRAGDAR